MGILVTQCAKGSGLLSLEAAPALISLMGMFGRFGVFASCRGQNVFFDALTIVGCVNFVIGRDVGCCKI
jgi:hypothetical protein